MAIDFQKLLELQECDLRIRQVQKESEDIPARKDDIESMLSGHKAALHDADEDLKKHGLKIKELEGEIEGQKQKISKYREQQLQVKNNDEYRALENEIKTAEGVVRELEDQELVVMEESEELKQTVAVRTRELKEEESVIGEDLVALDDRLKDLQQEISELESSREELKAGLDPQVLSRYERILSHRGRAVIVGINGQTCQGCHMQIPPQLVHDSRKTDSLTVCTYCGSILYFGA